MSLFPPPRFLRPCLLLLAPLLAPAQDQYLESDGVRIRYVEHGAGEPVVLIHGFTSNIEGWNQNDVWDSLAREYRVVALDLRGHGKSGKPHAPEMYGVHLATDVINLMDHLEIDRAHIVGYAMGARIAGYWLAIRPERFLSVVLGASPPRRTWSSAQIRRAEDYAARIEEMAEGFGTASPQQDYEALATITSTWGELVVTDEGLRAASVPALAIAGSEDRGLPGLQELAGIIRGMRVVVVENGTHGGAGSTLRDPKFRETLLGFLRANPGEN